jgi:hypothetical protein
MPRTGTADAHRNARKARFVAGSAHNPIERPTAPAVPSQNVRRGKSRSPSGRQTHPATSAPAGSNRSSRGGNEAAETSDGKGHVGDSASPQAATCSESLSRPRKRTMWKPTRRPVCCQPKRSGSGAVLTGKAAIAGTANYRLRHGGRQ